MNDRIVPVDVVELDLNELHFRVLVEDLNEEFRSAVIRESEMPDLAFCLLLDSPVEAVVLLVDLIVVSILNAVEEIELMFESKGSIDLDELNVKLADRGYTASTLVEDIADAMYRAGGGV